MSKFKIEVCRIGYSFRNIEVKADSLEEAQQKALDEAGDYLYNEASSEYKISS